MPVSVRYFDTGLNGPADSLGLWLESTLSAGIQAFRGQFGFYDGAVLRPFIPIFQRLVSSGGTFRLVIGSNTSEPPTTGDLADVLSLLNQTASTSLTVVGLSNALFHPKTMHIALSEGPHVGVAGSANFTRMGLGRSVEAGLILQDATGTDPTLAEMAEAIDRWAINTEPGVYQVRTQVDIANLEALGLAVTAAARRSTRSRQREGATTRGRGTREIGWSPASTPGAECEQETEATTGTTGVSAFPAPSVPLHQWAKKLKRSDAQQVPSGTNPTGKLRLGQARFPITQETWFRDVLFGDQNWVQSSRRGVAYEETHVPFQVSLHGSHWEPMTFKIDHGAHRVAGQSNVPTVLSWGTFLGEWLRNNNQIDNWVLIEKDVNGNYWLSIQATKPAWAP
jgi:hypothetical protein